jgi:DNA polymerase-3 subunit delta'
VSWQRVRGREAQAEAFDRIVRRGRLGHAYLFAGPAGVGKRLFADELAKALLCEAPDRPRLEACDQCQACALVAAGTHPDLFTIGRPEETLELPTKVVRDLCRDLGLKPARGRGKVAIVDDADDLNDESANRFLKTLEEPPPRSVLLLVGTSAQRQLPTILSRCQVVYFPPLPDSLVREILREQGVEEAQVERLARMSGGSPGRALALTDPELWEFRQKLLQALTRIPFDSVGLGKAWTHFVEEAGKEAAAQRRRAAVVLALLIDFLEAALPVSLGAAANLADDADRKALEQFASRTDPEQVTALLDRCLEADRQIDCRVQLVLILEALTDALGQKLRTAT